MLDGSVELNVVELQTACLLFVVTIEFCQTLPLSYGTGATANLSFVYLILWIVIVEYYFVFN